VASIEIERMRIMIKKVEAIARLGPGFKIEVKIREHSLIVDQPKASGGNDQGPTPLEYLMLSLAGCIGAIGRIIANQRKLPVRSMDIAVEGDIDVDVLLGKSEEPRAGFTAIRARVKIDADMTVEEKRKFLHDIDLRCPISDNIARPTPVSLVVEE
jgi:putative redox protein